MKSAGMKKATVTAGYDYKEAQTFVWSWMLDPCQCVLSVTYAYCIPDFRSVKQCHHSYQSIRKVGEAGR